MIYLQDCTLSDGGEAIGGWFGDLARHVLSDTIKAGSRYVEIGTLCSKEYNANFTNFNHIMQTSALLQEKEPSVRYGVCVRADDFALIDRLPEHTADSVDFIRVVFPRDKRSEALSCCKTIMDRGYGVMVHPLLLSLYSGSKLTALMDKFSSLSPEAFVIDDSFGAFSADELRWKLKAAERGFPADTAIGFCGRDYMYRESELTQVLAEASEERTILVHATAGGIGKPGRAFSCEVVSQFLNGHRKPDTSTPYCVERYMDITQKLYGRYGASLNPIMTIGPVRIQHTASENCDPNWALYTPVNDEQFGDFIAQLSTAQKHHADEDGYEEAARRFYQKIWNKKLAVIVPTANRPESIRYYLQQAGKAHEFFGIDLIFYDSSRDDKTERIVKEFTEGKSKHIIYERYTGAFDGISIDEKGIAAYEKYSLQYEYLWMTRDGWLVDLSRIYLKLYEYLEKKPDACVLYAPGEDIQGIGYKEYTSCTELFRDSCRRMTVLGSCFFSSTFMRNVLKNHPLDMKINYGMWQPIAMFAQWAEQPLFVISDTIQFYIGNPYGTEKSFWNKNGRALWQVTENWYVLISNLPDIYDNDKPEVLKIGHAIFTPFAFRQLLIMRTTGSLTVGKVKQYAKYLPIVSKYPLKRFYTISMIPKCLCRAMINPRNIIGKVLYKLSVAYSLLSRFPPLPSPLPKNHDIAVFDVDEKNNDVVFAENELCILFPVHDRADILRDNLERTLAQYEAYHIPVIVYNAGPGDEVRSLVDELASHHRNIRYARYEGAPDALSDDDLIFSAYKSFSQEYRYLWIVRDICLVDLNTCAYQLCQAVRENKDLIVLSRESIKKADQFLYATEYNDACELFRDTFCASLFPENMIVSSNMMEGIMRKHPPGESNCGFWQMAASFHYIAGHTFSAAVLSAEAFCYHHSNLVKIQEKNSLWLWVDRLCAVFDMLPEEYADERETVLRRLDLLYSIARPLRLLWARAAGKYRLRDVFRYGRKVALVSGTSFSQLVRVGLTPRFLAKLKIARPGYVLWRHSVLDSNTEKIGKFDDHKSK